MLLFSDGASLGEYLSVRRGPSVDLNLNHQEHIEHHGNHNVEVGEVEAHPPSQVEEEDEDVGKPPAKDSWDFHGVLHSQWPQKIKHRFNKESIYEHFYR
jgi:hypothetical protein